MRQIIIFVLLSLFSVLAISGCAPKVDCNKLEARMIACKNDNYKALHPEPDVCPLGSEECVKNHEELTTRYAQIVDTQLVIPCRKNSGRDTRAARINKCLDLKDCAEMHACLKEVTR